MDNTNDEERRGNQEKDDECPGGVPGEAVIAADRANHCHGSYVLHLYCCAPSNLRPGSACNALGEFTGDSFREASATAKAAGWKLRVAGIAAWCPTHAGRSFEERCMDFADRAACTAPGWSEP